MLGALSLWASLAWSQTGPELHVDPTIQVRSRGLFNWTDGIQNGFLRKNAVVERSRLGIGLQRGDFSAKVVVQQFRGWVPDDGSYLMVPSQVEFIEAWGGFARELPANVGLAVKLGRQFVTIHEGRLIGSWDWSFRGTPQDGVNVRLDLGGLHVQALNYRNFDDPTNLSVPGTTVVVAGFGRSTPMTEYLTDALVIAEAHGGRSRITAGTWLFLATGRLELGGEAYVQTIGSIGEAQAPADPASLSGLGSLRVVYTFGPERFLRVRAQYDILTHNLLFPGEPGGFAAPAPDSFQFNGHMNLFRRPEDTAFRGLQDLQLSGSVRINPRWTLDGALHHFWFAYESRPLGAEADLSTQVHLSPVARLGGHAFVFRGFKGLRELDAGPRTRWLGVVELELGI